MNAESGSTDTQAGDTVAAAYLRQPHLERGMTVGLFGGSFNPPHEGHALVAQTALRRLGLDRLWWMVSPGNPLKNAGELLPLAERIARCEEMAGNPRMVVTAIEAAIGLRYTADTLALLQRRNPGIFFVWVMGADSLRDFHHWRKWKRIAEIVPIATIDRPGASFATLSSPMARRYSRRRLAEEDARLLPFTRPPAWTFIHARRSPLSSTSLRAEKR